MARLYLPREYTLLVLVLLGILALVYYAAGRFRWFLPAGVVCAAVAIVLGVQMQKGVVTMALVGTAGNPAVVCVQDGQAVVLFRGGEANLRAVRSYLADHGAAEQVLTVDLRRSGTEITFDTEEICTAQTTGAYTTRPILNGLTLDIYHTSGGNLAVVGDGRSHIAVMAGSTALSAPVAVDVLCAAGALSDLRHSFAAILTTASSFWPGLTSRVQQVLPAAGHSFIQLRPGRSLQIMLRQNALLYSENELNKRLRSGCVGCTTFTLPTRPSSTPPPKALKVLNEDDLESHRVLDGPAPGEEIAPAAGTILFGGRRLVLMPSSARPPTRTRTRRDLCDTLADTENAIFVMTSGAIEESSASCAPASGSKADHGL